MQLSIKDSDLKGVFNLKVNDIVFLLCKDNIWMFIFSRKGPSFVPRLLSSLHNRIHSKPEVRLLTSVQSNCGEISSGAAAISVSLELLS